MRKVLPQANDLDKVIDVMKFVYYNPGTSALKISEYVGFTERQAKYYTNACVYLDLIDKDNRPTIICKDIFEHDLVNITERVYERIILDELMGQVFARALLFPDSDLEIFSQHLVSSYYPNIVSSSTFLRRSHNIVLWVKRIIKYTVSRYK